MKKVGIIGSGTMGIGIAQVAATNECEVFLFDVGRRCGLSGEVENKGRMVDFLRFDGRSCEW